MLQTLKNAWNTKEIRGKILFTLFILLLYRIGTVIPVPFVEAHGFAESFSGTILDQLNILSGGALGTATLFALGVSPYINSSIIIQLLAVVFPSLGELAKTDKSKMNLITRITTVVLAIITALGYYLLLHKNGMLTNAAQKDDNPATFWIYAIVIVTCYVAGASLVMWLSERINEKGIGNGISIILFANIISVLPSFFINLVTLVVDTYTYSEKAWLYGIVSTLFALLLIASMVALVIFVIWITGSERRIPVVYAKQIKGRKMFGGQKQDLPIKLNMTGVMPIIFASSIVSLVPTILAMFEIDANTKGFWGTVSKLLATDGVIYPVSLFLLIIAFSYFYTQISFDPVEVSNRIKSQGGTLRGIRQGKPTVDFIKNVLNKVTIVGALFLGIIAILPVIAGPHLIQHLLNWIMGGSDMAVAMNELIASGSSDFYTTYYISMYQQQIDAVVSSLTSTFTFGGTSLLIMVGVVLETFRELEAQLTLRNYKGFL